MFSVTEETLVLAKQPQQLLKQYQVPAAKVVNMIREAMVEIKQIEKEWLGEARPPSPSQVYFAARRHRYQNKGYVVRISYGLVKNKVVVSSAEIVAEKDYQPILPL